MIENTDVLFAVTSLLDNKFPDRKVYVDDVSNPARPFNFVDIVSFSSESIGDYRQRKRFKIDVKYYPKSEIRTSNLEILGELDKINNSFEYEGKKILPLSDDRLISMEVSNMDVIDNVGHYIFVIEFITSYGERPTYEKMETLYLKMGNLEVLNGG